MATSLTRGWGNFARSVWFEGPSRPGRNRGHGPFGAGGPLSQVAGVKPPEQVFFDDSGAGRTVPAHRARSRHMSQGRDAARPLRRPTLPGGASRPDRSPAPVSWLSRVAITLAIRDGARLREGVVGFRGYSSVG